MGRCAHHDTGVYVRANLDAFLVSVIVCRRIAITIENVENNPGNGRPLQQLNAKPEILR